MMRNKGEYMTQEDTDIWCREQMRDYLSKVLISEEKRALDPFGMYRLIFTVYWSVMNGVEYEVYSDHLDVLKQIMDKIVKTNAEGLFKDGINGVEMSLVNIDKKTLSKWYIEPGFTKDYSGV